MKKILNLLIFAFVVSNVTATVTPVDLTWKNGTTGDDRDIEQGASEILTFTYNSDEATTLYMIVDANSPSWGNIVLSQAFQVVAGDGNTVDVEIQIPTDAPVTDAVRIYQSATDGGQWGVRLTPHKLRFINIKAASGSGGEDPGEGEGSTLKVNTLTWEGGSTGTVPLTEQTYRKVKITYQDAQAEDSLYLLVAYRDNWALNQFAKKIAFPVGQTEIIDSFLVRPYSADTDIRGRLILGETVTTTWGDQVDVGTTGNAKDAMYFDNQQAGVVVVEEATAITTDQHNDTAEPAGGNYTAGTPVTLTIAYNSTNATTFDVSFKTKDNVTKYFGQQENLPATTQDSTYTFTVDIPATQIDCDSMMIVGWIGSYAADKRLYEYINVTATTSVDVDKTNTLVNKLYPNPTTGQVTLELESAARLSIYDLSGKMVYNGLAQAGVNSLDLSSTSTGLYFVNIEQGGRSEERR